MSNHAIIVEGAHDASFLGQLLKNREYKCAKKLSDVPDGWQILFPTRFPMDGVNLERVMRFPEVYINKDKIVGIVTSGSDSRLISTLRSTIEGLGAEFLTSVAVFIDVDDNTASNRFNSVKDQIVALNSAALKEEAPGFPIPVPVRAGEIEEGNPSVGVFLFPNNADMGALENILINCAEISHKGICEPARNLISQIDSSQPKDCPSLKKLRAGMGRSKAIVGTIANVLKPGVSVASSLAQTDWLNAQSIKEPNVEQTDEFLGQLIGM